VNLCNRCFVALHCLFELRYGRVMFLVRVTPILLLIPPSLNVTNFKPLVPVWSTVATAVYIMPPFVTAQEMTSVASEDKTVTHEFHVPCNVLGGCHGVHRSVFRMSFVAEVLAIGISQPNLVGINLMRFNPPIRRLVVSVVRV